MEALILVGNENVFRRLGYASLFQYAVHALRLSEAVAYNAISVARKAIHIPALREAVRSGELGLAKARKVLPAIRAEHSPELQSAWIEKAVHLSSRRLERAVATECPRQAVSERATYRSKERIELVLGVSEKLMLDLRKAQHLASNSRRAAATLEDTLMDLVAFYLERKDPDRKALRMIVKKGSVRPGLNPASRRGEVRSSESGPAELLGFESVELPGSEPAESPVPLGQVYTPTSRMAEKSRTQSMPRVAPRTPLRTPPRSPLKAALAHTVRFRDRGRCQAIAPGGDQCGSRRWLEVHHILPVHQGGRDELENLITLCRSHHQAQHYPQSGD